VIPKETLSPTSYIPHASSRVQEEIVQYHTPLTRNL
jgi:hypothetical protein